MGLHPPKIETFDVAAGTNTDPKGFVRAVEVYREEPFGLYVSRPMVDHPTLTHLRSWLLPGLGVRVTDFSWRPGHERLQDHYLDIVDITRDGTTWWTEDHDPAPRRSALGERTEVLDLSTSSRRPSRPASSTRRGPSALWAPATARSPAWRVTATTWTVGSQVTRLPSRGSDLRHAVNDTSDIRVGPASVTLHRVS